MMDDTRVMGMQLRSVLILMHTWDKVGVGEAFWASALPALPLFLIVLFELHRIETPKLLNLLSDAVFTWQSDILFSLRTEPILQY